MKTAELVELLHSGTANWNQWRAENPSDIVDLTKAKLKGLNLEEANLTGARLYRADLQDTQFWRANLSGADLREANLRGANLRKANLSYVTAAHANISRAVCWNADFYRANLHMADFWGTDLSEALMQECVLTEARLHGAILVKADLRNADLSKSMVYGSSIWDAKLDGATQRDLVITPDAGRQKWHGFDRMEIEVPVMTVDNLKMAQFIYLLLNNAEIRDVIDMVAKKAVLILGRFTLERKIVLEMLREELRQRGYLPILFDCDVPKSRDITETVRTLAHMARFIIADITDAKSIPQELSNIVPFLPSVPVQPIIHVSDKEYGMFEHFGRYPWVLTTYQYESMDILRATLTQHVIEPVEQKAKEIRPERLTQ